MLAKRQLVALEIAACVVLLTCVVFFSSRLTEYVPDHYVPSILKQEKLAYVTVLTSRTKEDEEDLYYNMVRMIGYKLHHKNETKTVRNIPVVVLVTPTVPESRREKLREDGMIVEQVDYINAGPVYESGPERWHDTMTKFRVWELEQYDKVLYIDSDMYIVHALDDIWDDPAASVIKKRPHVEEPSDEFPAPVDYLFAASDYVHGAGASRPPGPDRWFNAGFMMLKPDKLMFARYESILHLPEQRGDEGSMDQGLLNYAHNLTGATPWARLTPGRWVANFPTMDDYKRGTSAMHEKIWGSPDQELKDMYFKEFEEMQTLLGK